MKDMSSYSPSSNQDDDEDDFLPITLLKPTGLLRKLTSFSSNISRLRMAGKKITLDNQTSDTQIKAEAKSNTDAIINAANSLVYFLREETTKLSSTASCSADALKLQWNDATTFRDIAHNS